MEATNARILNQIKQFNCFLYQNSHSTDDYDLDFSKFWISYEDFLSLQIKFPLFSNTPLISGLLFSKSKQLDKDKWFQSRFYKLYKEYLILFSKKNLEIPKKVLLLKGVHLRLLTEVLTKEELKAVADAGILEQKSIILSRKNDFQIFFAGTDEMHDQWQKNFKKCCILHNFYSSYNLLTKIAKGSTSSIYEAVSKKNKKVAVKIFDKIQILLAYNHNKVFLSIENEINVLRMLNHDCLLHLKEAYEEKEFIILVFEQLIGGNLFQKLKQRNYPEAEIKTIMKQLFEGISHLHEKNIMHRDIKLENIFFVNNIDLTLKLGDFGLAEYEKKNNFISTRCGTPGYVAPEILSNEKYSKKCDLFSLGILLYIMITSKPLFFGQNINEVLKKNKSAKEIIGKIDFSRLNASPECIDLLKNLLEISSELRFSVNEAMSHNWFQNSKMQFSSNSKSSPLNKTACFEKNFFRFQKPYFDESYSIIKKKPVFKISESLVSRKNSCKNKDKDDEKNICELLSFKNKYYFNKQSSSSLKSFLEKNAIRTNELKNKSMKIEEVKNQNELEKIFGIHNLDI